MARSSAARVRSKESVEAGSVHRPAPSSRKSEEKASAQQPETSVNPVEPPVEPDDAQITGTSRSLQRRVLGLNVGGKQAQQPKGTPAAQHATGSFTGSPRGKKKG